MSKSDTFENDFLRLIFNGTSIGNIADNTATSPATVLTVALHTADPGEAGTQATSETTYAGYARVSVARSTGGWVVTANSVSPAVNLDFPECTGTPGAAITHFSVGTGTANALLYSGSVTPSIAMATGVIPRLKTTSTITEDWAVARGQASGVSAAKAVRLFLLSPTHELFVPSRRSHWAADTDGALRSKVADVEAAVTRIDALTLEETRALAREVADVHQVVVEHSWCRRMLRQLADHERALCGAEEPTINVPNWRMVTRWR